MGECNDIRIANEAEVSADRTDEVEENEVYEGNEYWSDDSDFHDDTIHDDLDERLSPSSEELSTWATPIDDGNSKTEPGDSSHPKTHYTEDGDKVMFEKSGIKVRDVVEMVVPRKEETIEHGAR